MIYEYKILNIPDLDVIDGNIKTLIINNQLNYLFWEENSKILKIVFINELDLNDKIILDQIINNY